LGSKNLPFKSSLSYHETVSVLDKEFDFTKSVELALTELDQRIETLSKAETGTPEDYGKYYFSNARAATKQILRFFFDSIRNGPAALYERFAQHYLSGGDSVVSFNYDLAIDRELHRSKKWTVGDGYGFDLDTRGLGESPCKLFKLHGSTNWSSEPFGGMMGTFGQMNGPPLGQRPVITSPELEWLGYPNARDPRCNNGRVQIGSLIMPTEQKKFYFDTSAGHEWEEFWNEIWFAAARQLRTADEVYLIGYSIPECDTRARELLRSAVGDRVPVKVCCHAGTHAVVNSLKKMGVSGAEPASKLTFDDLMKAQ
jgi:hypothetical protein